MRICQRRLDDGERIPRGYGLAYHVVDRLESVFYPIPLNWVVGWCHRAWFLLRRGPKQHDVERLYADREHWRKMYAQMYDERNRLVSQCNSLYLIADTATREWGEAR